MWPEGALVARDAQRLQAPLDLGRKFAEIVSGGDPCPEDARVTLVREKTDVTEGHLHRRRQPDCSEFGTDALDLFRRGLADELQRDMHPFQAHPARPAARAFEFPDQAAESAAHFLRNLECDEDPHRVSRRLSLGRNAREEVAPHHVQGRLGGLPADAVAVARKTQAALLRARLLGERDVHGPDRLLRRAAAWARNSRYAQAQRAS